MPVRLSWQSFSGLGMLVGAVFFAASLTPSLIPRTASVQGVLGGISFAMGYALGVLILWAWWYLELPAAGERLRRLAVWSVTAAAAVIVIAFLWRAADWQNSIRLLMGMPPVDSARPLQVGLIAAGVAALLILIGKLFLRTRGLIARRLERVMPRRVSQLLGVAGAVTLFFLVVDGLLLRAYLRTYDGAQAALDALLEPDVARPSEPWRTGSAASLVSWQDLGRQGRAFVGTGPSAEDIAAFTGRPARDPLRIYVGLNAAPTPEERAAIALEELLRVDGFGRSALVVAVPTGTGWVDPASLDPLEYLLDGDVATVAVQYSYLESWVSLLVEPDYGVRTGRALFRAIYRHWTQLPPEGRPRLYLHGLSLGALGSEQSLRLHDVLADPVHGAVWAGPPFPSPEWRNAVEEREPGTPVWLPVFGDGSIIRFANQAGPRAPAGAEWGPMRIVYLQYASDPIVFFEPSTFYRRPAWMESPLGPDVSPEVRWYPIVTFLQLVLDMAVSLNVPAGHGHRYAAEHYIDAWRAVLEPEGWSEADVVRLKAAFAAARARAEEALTASDGADAGASAPVGMRRPDLPPRSPVAPAPQSVPDAISRAM
jgi:uncharacterized membrane protein